MLAGARRAVVRRQRVTRFGTALVAVVVAVTGLTAAFGTDGTSERVTVTGPSDSAARAVVLADGPTIWPSRSSGEDRSSAESVAAQFVASVTGEQPVDAVPRSRTPDPHGSGPTDVDVRLGNGVTIAVFVAPEGARGWRVLQVRAATGLSVGPMEPGVPGSPVRLRFSSPSNASSATIYYSTPAGTFTVDVPASDLRRGAAVLPDAKLLATETDVGAAVLVLRSENGAVVGIQSGGFGLRETEDGPPHEVFDL